MKWPQIVVGLLCGAFIPLGVLGILSIGLPFLVAGLALLVVGLSMASIRGVIFACCFLIGFGAMLGGLGLMNADYQPCGDSRGSISIGKVKEGQSVTHESHCGGIDGRLVAVIGVAIVLVGGAGLALGARRSPVAPRPAS